MINELLIPILQCSRSLFLTTKYMARVTELIGFLSGGRIELIYEGRLQNDLVAAQQFSWEGGIL